MRRRTPRWSGTASALALLALLPVVRGVAAPSRRRRVDVPAGDFAPLFGLDKGQSSFRVADFGSTGVP